MADNIRRYFWIVPGKTDKDGRPIEYDQAPTYVPVLGTKPVQILEEMTPDGEYIQYKHNADSGQWEEFTRGVDKARLDLYNARKREEPKKQTPDEARKEKADADVAEANANKAKNPPRTVVNTDANEPNIVYSDGTSAPNPNYRKPPMINRGSAPTPGTNAAVDDPRAQTADIVTKDQAEYDLKAEQEKRAQQQAALQQAQQAEANAIAKGRLAVEQGQLTAQQARDRVNEELERIRLSLSAESNQLTKRGQDVSMRNADLSAGVSQRGQDMDYTSRLASAGTSLASAMLPYWNAPGQVESTNSLMAGGPPVPTRPTSAPPFNPNLPTQLAQQAQGTVPQQYTLPQVPGAAAGKYQLPPAA
jgi:hypothetical protein